MESLLRFGKSLGIVTLACALFVALLAVIWQFLVGVETSLQFIVTNLLAEQFAEDPDVARDLASSLSILIQYTVLAVFGVTLCASASWLAITNFVHVNGHGEADTWLWARFIVILTRFIVILIGAAVSAAVPIYIFKFGDFDGGDLLREHLVILSVLYSVIVFAVFFMLFGSLLATPKHMRTAVPLASKLLKG